MMTGVILEAKRISKRRRKRIRLSIDHDHELSSNLTKPEDQIPSINLEDEHNLLDIARSVSDPE